MNSGDGLTYYESTIRRFS